MTDLDGTLMDHATYGFEPAREALDVLQANEIPLVIATSKTLLEVHGIAAVLGAHPILIVENGGALIIPFQYALHVADERRDAGPLVVELGETRDRLVYQLAEIAAETGARLRGFHQLSTQEVANLTGLSRDTARLARERRYDEPFLAGDDDLPAIRLAAARRGLSVTRGGRFHHLTGPANKGSGLEMILKRFAGAGRRFTTVGLGDAPNDLPFLSLVDRPVVMPRPGGDLDPELAVALPHAERAPCPGPEGWNRALMAIVAGGRLTSIGGAPP